jgi:bis(5'-nucleosyl)-tetraphosphatase (symmetrical)
VATYAIGDIQGCYREFQALLVAVDFDAARDRLWLTGDLVNRGPHSLAVLRAVKALGERAIVVLGNHDLHLIGCARIAQARPRRKDTIQDVLAAPDRDELIDWLRHRPLLHHDAALGYTLVHAGLPPQWDLATARACAQEVETRLRGADYAALLAEMYSDEPRRWSAGLRGPPRARFIINALTRIRYCTVDGDIDLREKGEPGGADTALVPWFAARQRASRALAVVFGHWSSLRLTSAECAQARVYPLDTGAVWGGSLSAMRLEDGVRYAVPSTTKVSFD